MLKSRGQNILQVIYNVLASVFIWWFSLRDIASLPGEDGLGEEIIFDLIILPILALVLTPMLLWRFQHIVSKDGNQKFTSLCFIILASLLIGLFPFGVETFTIPVSVPVIIMSGMILWSIPIVMLKIEYMVFLG